MLIFLTICILTILFFIGASLGSFASAIAHRHPRGKSWIFDDAVQSKKEFSRSACPHCHHPLAPRDLIPILSWLLLKGRCRYCQISVSYRYPLAELAGGVVMVTAGVLSSMNSVVIIVTGLCLPALLSFLLIKIEANC